VLSENAAMVGKNALRALPLALQIP